MEFLPAIDLMDGEVVRLKRGVKREKVVYGDPLETARRFREYVEKIHVVDLDGAFDGVPRNLSVVEDIIEETDLDVQYGGGLRNYQDVERAYEAGVENAIIGTKALEESFIERITDEFEGVTVSLDVKNGMVALEGWKVKSEVSVKEAYQMVKEHVDRFIYTSIERDGVLEGLGEWDNFWNDEEFIYAGGVSSLTDVLRLKRSEFSGFVVGRALYEGALNLEDIERTLRCEDAG
ncbi:MAG: 1-(5-phosphoribosyl)-5-((5-phosphoribosylamino)methylideneamino)imidazole-4-carboxamide isomerase [Thermoplasmata archaeon]